MKSVYAIVPECQLVGSSYSDMDKAIAEAERKTNDRGLTYLVVELRFKVELTSLVEITKL